MNTRRRERVAEVALIWCCLHFAGQNVRLAKEAKQARAITDRSIDDLEYTVDAIDWSQQDVCE